MISNKGAEQLLTEDHAELDQFLRRLIATLEANDAKKAFAQLDFLWARLAMHIRAENLHLFPTILKALEGDLEQRTNESPSFAEATEAVARLSDDHNFFMHELADLIKVMRQLRTDTPGTDVATELSSVRERIGLVQERLEAHNELEERFVYQWPNILLQESGQTNLANQVLREISNRPPRFSSF